MEYLLIVVVTLISLVIGLTVGYRYARKQLAFEIGQLEHRIQSLNWWLEQDPQRGLIDHGQTWVLNDMQNLIDRTKKGITGRLTKAQERKEMN